MRFREILDLMKRGEFEGAGNQKYDLVSHLNLGGKNARSRKENARLMKLLILGEKNDDFRNFTERTHQIVKIWFFKKLSKNYDLSQRVKIVGLILKYAHGEEYLQFLGSRRFVNIARDIVSGRFDLDHLRSHSGTQEEEKVDNGDLMRMILFQKDFSRGEEMFLMLSKNYNQNQTPKILNEALNLAFWKKGKRGLTECSAF